MRRGATVRGPRLSAKVIETADGTIRFAAVVPKTLAGSAPERNRLRRALYRAADTLSASSKYSSGAHIALLLRARPPEPAAQALAEDLKRLFSPER
jgi:ribonuclease P protein component